MSKLTKALTAAAGNAAGESLYVEDVFSTYLYTGNSSNRSITNGIDLDGEGGLVWVKSRGVARNHHLVDTERGASTGTSPGKTIYTNSTSAEAVNNDIKGFNTNGFDLGSADPVNNLNEEFTSWTFRKAEKFFDVVTYTGSAATQNIAHNLGSTPGMIIIKRTDTGPSDWIVYHQGLNNGTDPEDYYLILNGTASENNAWIFNKTAPTDTTFTVGGGTGNVNTSGGTYVAYLFASDAGGFGDDGSESIIKCGSYTGTGAAGNEIDLGFEPQFIIFKRTDSASDWVMFDSMRGLGVSGSGNSDSYLYPNLSNAEGTLAQIAPTATGFVTEGSWGEVNASGGSYIYIAIRRPMKTPESGTEVFAIDTRGSTADGNEPAYRSGFPVDMAIRMPNVTSTHNNFIGARLTQGTYLRTESTDAELASSIWQFDYMNGWNTLTTSDSNEYSWMFKRATGFFDVVAYTGTGTAQTLSHNLGATPEMVIVKRRDGGGSESWVVQHSGLTGGIGQGSGSDYVCYLNSSNAQLDSDGTFNFAPTSTTFALQNNGNSQVNASGGTYIAYLFATLAGVSKVGSYTGTGNSLDIDCGFANGARFVMIKRTDSSSDWWVWDTARGIVAGNDPTLRLNSTAAETTTADYIDPLSSGFTLTTEGNWLYGMNYPTGNYIFLAIA